MRSELQRLYQRHRQGLFSLALSITRCAASAEDAVQAAFERMWRRGTRPAGDPVAYVFAAVRNAALDELRRRGSPATHVSIFADRPGDSHDPAQQMLTTERDAMIRDAVDALPQQQRTTVVMRLYGGLTFDQIARSLGEPLQTVASRYRRALERLSPQIEARV